MFVLRIFWGKDTNNLYNCTNLVQFLNEIALDLVQFYI